MDEYQETIWNALDNYHKRLWAPTVGMHGPWNDYKWRQSGKAISNFYRNLWLYEDKENLKELLHAIIRGYMIEDHGQPKQALEKMITERVRPLAEKEYFERLNFIEEMGRYPGSYFDRQDLERDLGEYLKR